MTKSNTRQIAMFSVLSDRKLHVISVTKYSRYYIWCHFSWETAYCGSVLAGKRIGHFSPL